MRLAQEESTEYHQVLEEAYTYHIQECLQGMFRSRDGEAFDWPRSGPPRESLGTVSSISMKMLPKSSKFERNAS